MLGPRKMESDRNIHEITEHVRQLIEAEAKGGLEIERDYDPSLPDFPADGGQLTQAVLNLVRTPGKPAVGWANLFQTRVLRQLPLAAVATSWLRVAGDRRRARRIRRTAAPARMRCTGNAKGTEPGLSIAQRIANQHGGECKCRGAPASHAATGDLRCRNRASVDCRRRQLNPMGHGEALTRAGRTAVLLVGTEVIDALEYEELWSS